MIIASVRNQSNNEIIGDKTMAKNDMQSDELVITIRITFEHDGRMSDRDERNEYVAAKVIGDALSHTHTIENGIQIHDIENCGENW